MPPASGTSTRPNPPTTSTSGMPNAMRPRERPNHALTTSAAPTSPNASANTTPRSTSTAPAASSSHAVPASTSSKLHVSAPRYDRGRGGEARSGTAGRRRRLGSASAGAVTVPGGRGRPASVVAGRRAVRRAVPCREVPGAQPQHRGAETDEHERPERAVAAERPPEASPDRQQPERDQPVAEQLPTVTRRR